MADIVNPTTPEDRFKNIPGVPEGYREDPKPTLTEEEAEHVQMLRDEGKLPPMNNRLKAASAPAGDPANERMTFADAVAKGE